MPAPPGTKAGIGGGSLGDRPFSGGMSSMGRDWSRLAQAAGLFNQANKSYLNRSPAWDVMDFLAGPFMDLNEPNLLNHKSWKGGNWHTSSNPGGILAGMAGMAMPGLGLLTGPLGSYAWNKAGLPSMWHGQGAGGVPAASMGHGGQMSGGLLGAARPPVSARPGKAKAPAAPRPPLGMYTAFGGRR